MEWLSKYDVRSRRLPSGNRVISELIYELTGQVRCRKQISNHIQVLKMYSRLGRTETAQDVDTQQATKVVNPGPAVSYENSTILTKISDSLSTTASKSKGTLSLHCSTTFAQKLLSLSFVNRLYRNECLHHLASNIRFDFGFDGHALQHFCSTAPAEILKAMRHLRITLVEGYMPQLPDLPNLHTLAVDLWPRNPTRGPQNIHRPDSTDRAWGTQTEKLLDGSGVVLAVRARIRLEMRWAADCERFEREYVERGRWRRVIGDDENGAPDQGGPICRRCYELCGNGKIVVEVTGKEKEAASAGGGLVFWKFRVAPNKLYLKHSMVIQERLRK